MEKAICVNQDCPVMDVCSRHTKTPHLYTDISVFTWHDADGIIFCEDFSEEEYLKKGLANADKFIDKIKQILPDEK